LNTTRAGKPSDEYERVKDPDMLMEYSLKILDS
jgi:hypothetical protein